MPSKGQPGNGQTGFKSSRNPGRANPKPSVPDSGNPGGQYSAQAPAADWKSGGPADSGKPSANK